MTKSITATIPIGGVPRKVSHVRNAAISVAYFLIPVVGLVFVWEIATKAVGNSFFPSPSSILGHAFDKITSGTWLLDDILPSLGRIGVGFLIGALWGIVVGVCFGLFDVFRYATTPVIEFLRSIPATALLPLFIVLFGGGDDMRVLFIAYGVSWYVLLNTAAGVRAVDQSMINMARTFRLTTVQIIIRVIIPATMPKVFAGVRIASTAALLLAIVSEFMLATNGIGFQLVQTQARFQLLDMWSWMVILAVIGLVINFGLETIENRVLRWHIGATARD